MKNLLLATIILVMGVWGCKKEKPDTEKPVIAMVKINNQGSGQINVAAGSIMQIYVSITDNKNLKQFKIDIHDAFDGHGHRANAPFSVQNIYTISGTSFSDTKNINIPANAASGPYHLTVYAIDESGNEASFYELDFNITQTGQPVINISSPDINNDIEVSPTDTIHISGNITDDIDLEEIHIELVKSVTAIYDETFDLSAGTIVNWDFNELIIQNKQIIIPANATAGHYDLIIKVKDNDANLSVLTLHIDIN